MAERLTEAELRGLQKQALRSVQGGWLRDAVLRLLEDRLAEMEAQEVALALAEGEARMKNREFRALDKAYAKIEELNKTLALRNRQIADLKEQRGKDHQAIKDAIGALSPREPF